MSDYSIKLGVELDTKKIDNQINSYKSKKPIELNTKLDTSDIDKKLASYKAKKPIEVDAKLNTTGLAKKIGEYKPKTPIKLIAELDTNSINAAIKNYEAKTPIKVGVKIDSSDISKKIKEYETKTPIKLNVKIDKGDINKQIREYESPSIKLNAKLSKKDIDSAIKNYKATPINLGVKLKKGDINNQIKEFKPNTTIYLKAALKKGAIAQEIRDYKPNAPIKVDLELDYSDIDKKVGEYIATKGAVELPVKLAPSKNGFASKITKTPVSIEATLKNPKDISDAIKAYVKNPVLVPVKLTPATTGFSDSIAKTPVKINAILNPEDINAAIAKFAPTAKVNVDVKLNPKDINAQVKGLVKPTEPINVGVKLDESSINADIALFKPTATLGIQPDLILENVEEQISAYVPKSKIKVNVKLDEDDINNATGKQNKQNPIQVNVKIDTKSINEQLKDFTTKTKIKVGVKLDKDDIKQQLQSVKTGAPIKIGVKLDSNDIRNVESQINNLRQRIQNLGNINVNLGSNRVGNGGNGGNGGNERQDIQTVRIARGVDDVTRAYRELLSIQNRMGSKQQAVAKLDTSKNAHEILELSNQIDELARKYQRIHQLFSGQFSSAQVDALNRNFEITAEKLSVIRQKALDAKDSLDRIGTSGNASTTNGTGENAIRQVDEVTQAYRELMGVLNELNSKRLQLNSLEASSPHSSEKIQTLRSQVEQLGNEYDHLLRSFNAQGIQFTADQWNQLETVMERVGRRIDVVQAGMSDKSAIQSQTQAYKELLSISKEIGSLEINIAKLKGQGGNSSQIEVLENQLRELQSTYQQLVTTMNTPLTNEQWSAIYTQIAKTSDEIERLKAKHADARAELTKDVKINISNGSLQNEISAVEQKFDQLGIKNEKVSNDILELQRLLGNMNESSDIESVTSDYQTFTQILQTVNNAVDGLQMQMNKDNRPEILDAAKEAAMQRLNGLFESGSQAAKKFGLRAEELRRELDSVGNVKGVEIVNKKIKNLGTEIKNSGLQVKTFGTSLKEQFARYRNYISIASVFMYATQAMRSMFEQVKLIDSAMTELKKVTNETDESYNKFLSNAASRARELGTTIDGLVSSTADFARLGYGFKDSQQLAEVANIYAVVGDEIEGVDDATQSLVSTMAAFKGEMNGMDDGDFAMGIVDKMNEVSNNFAISSGGIGQALQRSASSMAAANNTLDETIAMITAANEVAQNPEKVGNAMKTMSMRIRAAKSELEDAGESTEGMAESTASLRAEIKALSGVDIMLNENTFKSTYQIMDELSRKWEGLSDIAQATIIELMAGKHQGNVFASLMANFDTAREALDTSINSSGSAMKEHAKWSESLEARLNKLKAAWQGLSQAFMTSDLLKGALNAVIGLVDALTKLIDALGTIPALLTVFSGFKVLKTVFSTLGNGGGLESLGGILGTLQKAFPNVTKGVKKLVTSLREVSLASGGAGSAFHGFLSLILQHPYIAIAAVAVTALTSALMYQKKKAEELSKKVDELTEKYKEQHEELRKLKGDYDTDDESSMISKYEKLSKGVDNLGRNVSLTADEYSEYQSIVNSIAEQIPSLISGYDEQGNALLSVKGNVEELTAAYEKLIHAQNQEILTNTKDIEKNFKKQSKDAGNISFWEQLGRSTPIVSWFTSPEDLPTDVIKKLENALENPDSIKGKWIDYGWNGFDRESLRKALKDAGVDIKWYQDELTVLKKTLKNDPAKIKGIIDDHYEQFAEIVEQQKTIATAKLSEAFDISSTISGLDYGNISEDLQAVAYQVVNSLDKDFFDKLQEDGKSVENWITEMLNQLNTIGGDNNDKISAAFDLQTQFNGGKISYGEYVKGLEDAGKLIDGLNLKDEVKSQLKLSVGLDEKGFVEGYKKLKNRLASNEYFDILPRDYIPFIESLSSEELSVIWKVIPELEKTDYKETIADVKAALEKEMMLQGLTFDLNLEVEAAGIEALNTALAESVSATGLSSESITALKGRYADLESQGYDLSSMFEETSTGIRLNRQEFNKLENAYATDKLVEIDSELNEMKLAYDDLGEAIKNCDDPIRKSELFSERQTLANRISEAATLAHQYKGLTSAYNDWISAESAGQERDMYENVIKGFETVDDEISRGWIDDGAIEFLELLTGRTDLAGKSGKQLKEIYDGLDNTIKNTTYSVRDFFTVDEDGNSTNAGVYNFLDAIGQLEEEKFLDKNGNPIDVVKRDNETGNIIGFDFELAGGDEVIAEALGVSEELVQIMVRAADDAGFVISMDGTYRQLADLQNEAKAAADYLREIGKTDFEFDFNTSSVENLKTQLEEAHKILDDKKFWNKDGTFNFDADGATQAMQIVSTLQAKLDNLTAEKYGIGLTVEDEEFEEPLENLQDYGHKIAALNQLKLNPKANAEEIEKVNGELNEIAEYFANLDKDKKIELGFEADDGIEDVKKKIESGEIKIPTVLDIQANMDKNIETLADLALLNSGLLSEDKEETIRKKYSIEVEADEVDTSDVEEKVENAVIDGLGNPILSRQTNIEIIAKTFGIKDVDDLSSKLKGLDDKTIQAIAEAVGQGDVEALDLAISGMDGNTVDAVCNALGYDSLQELETAIRNMQGNEVDAVVNTDGQAKKVWDLQSVIDGLKGTAVNITLGIKRLHLRCGGLLLVIKVLQEMMVMVTAMLTELLM